MNKINHRGLLVVIATAIVGALALGCEAETRIQEVTYDDSGRIIDSQTYTVRNDTPTTTAICADGDYVSHPSDASVRAAQCYNAGQSDAFRLMFNYSGGRVYSGYCLETDQESAQRRANRTHACVVSVFIEDNQAHLVYTTQ